MKRKKKATAPRCPYCGSVAILRSAEGIYRSHSAGKMLYVCKKYPICDSYVRVHPGTSIPMGTLANKKLRELRQEAHRCFDQLYLQGLMTKDEAYLWLAEIVAAPLAQAHIGYLGEYYCGRVIEESQKILQRKHSAARSGRQKEDPYENRKLTLCPGDERRNAAIRQAGQTDANHAGLV